MNVQCPPIRLMLLNLLAVGAAPAALVAGAAPPGPREAGALSGRVSSAATGAYLGNARVAIEGTTREAITDETGGYRFFDLPPGPVRLRVSYLGLHEKAEMVTVAAGQSIQRDFELTLPAAAAGREVVALERFMVIENREMSAQTLALNEQRHAPNLKNVVAFDEYPSGYDNSLSYFLRFMPGVTSTGVAAQVRALPADMGQVTIDGAEVTSVYSGQTRSAASAIHIVPVNNISRIEVTKAPTPDLPAVVGGAINLISRSGFERKTPQFTYDLRTAFLPELGYHLHRRAGLVPKVNSRHILPSLDLNYLRPISRSLAVTLTASSNANFDYREGTNATWNLVDNFLASLVTNWIPSRTETKSGRLGVDWKLGDRHTFHASLQYRGRDSYYAEHGWQANFGAGATGGATFTQGRLANPSGSVSQVFSVYTFNTDATLALLKYRYLGPTWRVDGMASHSRSRSYYRNTEKGFFSSLSASVGSLIIRGDDIGAGRGIAGTRPARYTIANDSGAAVSPFDGNLLTLASATALLANYQSDKSEYRLDVARDWRGRLPVTLKAGLFLQPNESTGANPGVTYNFRPAAPAAERLVGAHALVDAAYSAAGPVYGGQRMQWLSPARVYDLFRNRPEYFVLDAPLAHRTLVNASKKLQETIAATYLRADLKALENRLWLVGGVRYERTDDEGWGPLNDVTAQYRKDAAGNLERNAAGQPIFLTNDLLERERLRYRERGTQAKRRYDGFFPSLNASFALREDLVARFAFARTIGRPPLANIIPTVTFPELTASDRVITVVNTGLRPWTADNYDLSLDAYLFKGGMGSIGVFQKDISGFFVDTRTRATADALALYGIPESEAALGYEIATRANGGEARLRGTELTYRQALSFLPASARGLQVFVNWTQRTVGGANAADFTGYTRESFSWGVNFARSRFVARFTYSTIGAIRQNRIASSATIPAETYDWRRPSISCSASAEYRLTKGLGLYASLTDFNTTNNAGGVIRYAAGTPEWARERQYLTNLAKAVIGVKGEY